MRKVNILLFMSLILLMTDCREPFLPDFETGKNDYLVVEGFINVGQKAVTSITLSRVAPLSGTSQVFEDGAILFIERKDGIQYPLRSKGNGNYISDSLNLVETMDYRLLIITSDDSQYASDFLTPKITPDIDSVHWEWTDKGMQIYVSTHDPENNTRYYKWNYVETWEYHSQFLSEYIYNNGVLEFRDGASMLKLYRCWKSDSLTDLRFASTLTSEADAIKFPLTLFAHYGDRTSFRYSILVEQHALTKEEFEYLQLIQKNSTLTGSLFDPMPSEINGNIHSLGNPDEKIIGYVGASTTTTKRLFITTEEFGVSPIALCEALEISMSDYEELYGSGRFIPVNATTGAQAYCMDCTFRGGVPIRPDFW